jgi:small GTP-binding protein
MDKKEEKLLRILIVGDVGVGKTSLMIRYTENKFNDNCATTIGVDSKDKILNINSSKHIIKVIDTAGQERYQTITKSFFHLVEGIFIVFDLTDDASFNSLEKWIEIIKEVKKEPNIIILANKSDLLDVKVEDDQLKDFSFRNQIKIIKISVKDDINIEEAFYDMINLIYVNPVIQRDSFVMNKENHRNTEKKEHCC